MLQGPFTIEDIFGIQSDLRSLKPPCLIIDLAGVPFMDSSALGVIMNAFVSAQGSGRKVLLANLSDRVRTLLETTRVDRVLPVFESVAAAESQQ
jgi:anti-sigma B factor antagonist